MTLQNISVNNGKYTVVFDDSNGKLTALRYGEPWRDIQGDNLIYWLAIELQEAREQVKSLNEFASNSYKQGYEAKVKEDQYWSKH